MTRRLNGFEKGYKRGENQEISVMEAIEALTINVAYQVGADNKVGSIEVGKAADLIVLGSNLFEIQANEIHKTEIIMTIVDGQVVYDSSK